MFGTNWTPAVYELMETLTCRVRVLSLQHIQRGWSEQFGSSRSAIEVIERLLKAGLLLGDVWRAPASPVGDQPLCYWSVGDVEPDLNNIEQIIRNRWSEMLASTPVVAATHRANRIFGSTSGGFPPENHRNHDLLLSEVYLRYRTDTPHLAERWLGEDAVRIAERGIKNPDAFLFDEAGTINRVIESAGRYSFQQLKSFHDHCESEELAYELW